MVKFAKIFRHADISETSLLKFDKETLDMLLIDHSSEENIIWGTDDYMTSPTDLSHRHDSSILVEHITGDNDKVIRPRALKSKEQQKSRSRGKAEVFTPAWICNAQNNLVDEEWFGYKNVFNAPNPNKRNPHEYILSPLREKDPEQKVVFPEGKSWKDYVCLNRMEVTCGEAPYLVNRYDSVSEKCRVRRNVRMRVGLLDRKLRVICENTQSEEEWFEWVLEAYRHCYGFEWQGDSLLLARENLLFTFFDFYQYKFGENKMPDIDKIRQIAYIISWNLWQMDGLTLQRPYTPKRKFDPNPMFEDVNDGFCRIMDWDEGKDIYFASLTIKGE